MIRNRELNENVVKEIVDFTDKYKLYNNEEKKQEEIIKIDYLSKYIDEFFNEVETDGKKPFEIVTYCLRNNTFINRDNSMVLDEHHFHGIYWYFCKLDKELRLKGMLRGANKLHYTFVMFYRFINIKEPRTMKLAHSKIFIQAIISKGFYKYYDLGYSFIYHNIAEMIPESNRICILPTVHSVQGASSTNTRWRGFDFTKCCDRYRETLKEFVWYNFTSKDYINNYNDLIAFLNYSFEEQYNNNVISFDGNKEKEFADDFLWSYRMKIYEVNENKGNIKAIFKIVRKFLKYYKGKYNVDKTDIDILNLAKLDRYDGGQIISDHDLMLIYDKLQDNAKKDDNYKSKLYSIVFEIFIKTKLRIGQILNLRRNCLIPKNDGNCSLSYIEKGKDSIKKEMLISKEVEGLIRTAVELTDTIKDMSELYKNFIFIEEYVAQVKDECKRINYVYELKKVIHELKDELERTDYIPYNIRHTYIDNVYKEGIANDLSLVEMADLAGNSYKTAKKHYRDANNLKSYLEALSGVCISDVNVKGEILSKEIKVSNKVRDGLGSCKKDSCTFDLGECLMCINFITFTNREIVFEKKINEIDEEMRECKNPLIVEELSVYKKLLVKYLYEIKKKLKKGI